MKLIFNVMIINHTYTETAIYIICNHEWWSLQNYKAFTKKL